MLSVLLQFPGVQGVSLLRKNADPLVQSEKISFDRMQKISVQAALFFNIGSSSQCLLQKAIFQYQKHKIIINQVNASDLLVIACEPNTNGTLLMAAVQRLLG